MILFAGLICIAAIMTFFASHLTYRLSMKYHLYPKIRGRDVHARPTPRVGGAAIFVGIALTGFIAWSLSSHFGVLKLVFSDMSLVFAIFGASFLIVIIGLIDDVWELDWLTKLAGQFIAAGLIAWFGVQIYSFPIGSQLIILSPITSILITLFAIVLVMNAINFIDGLDGLVVGIAIIANGSFMVYTYLLQREINPQNYFSLAGVIAALLTGACIGFLPFNWHPARMFMGDTGSLLIGLLMATSAISITGTINPETLHSSEGTTLLFPAFMPILLPFAVLLVPLLDFSLAVLRRVRAGKSPFSADRKHLHHRLLDMGHTHLYAVLIIYSWAAVIAIGSLLFFVQPVVVALLFIAVGLVGCTIVTLLPLSLGKKEERKAESAPAGSQLSTDTAQYDHLDIASYQNQSEDK